MLIARRRGCGRRCANRRAFCAQLSVDLDRTVSHDQVQKWVVAQLVAPGRPPPSTDDLFVKFGMSSAIVLPSGAPLLLLSVRAVVGEVLTPCTLLAPRRIRALAMPACVRAYVCRAVPKFSAQRGLAHVKDAHTRHVRGRGAPCVPVVHG